MEGKAGEFYSLKKNAKKESKLARSLHYYN